MTGPSNFERKDGAAGSTGRGRGLARRSASTRTRGWTGPRDARARGRGRGEAPVARLGRGRGASSANAAASNTTRNGPEAPSGHAPSSASPFARFGGHRGFATSGGQAPHQKSGTFGMPSSVDGAHANSDKARNWGTSTGPTNGSNGTSVPIEDASILNQYNKRHEEVGTLRIKHYENDTASGRLFLTDFTA